MPSVTAVALDSLLDRRSGGGGGGGNTHHHHHHHRSFYSRQQKERRGGGGSGAGNGSLAVETRRTSSFPNHFSPALYATPEPTRISGSSPTSESPSPYVVNIKRRDFRPPRLPKPISSGVEKVEEMVRSGDEDDKEEGERLVERGKDGALPMSGVCTETCLVRSGGLDKEEAGDDDNDDFFDPRDSLSVMSSSDTEDGGVNRRQVPEQGISLSTNSEFYDTTEDYFSDSSASHASSVHSNMETNFRLLRLNLFEEIEKRKKAEDNLSWVQTKWKKMASHLTHLGFSFPAMPDGSDNQHEDDEIEEVCQEIVVARFVSEALERGCARAEAEESAEMFIKSKNHEISRLHVRLQYYEAVNHEMSQRNQENIELARRKRQGRRRRQKLIWCCVGLSVTLGASLLLQSFLPHSSKGEQSPSESNLPC